MRESGLRGRPGSPGTRRMVHFTNPAETGEHFDAHARDDLQWRTELWLSLSPCLSGGLTWSYVLTIDQSSASMHSNRLKVFFSEDG